MSHAEHASVRYLVDDVQACVDFCTGHLGFELRTFPAPAFAEVARLRERGVPLRSEVVSGPGGRQVLDADPAGNLVEVFEPTP